MRHGVLLLALLAWLRVAAAAPTAATGYAVRTIPTPDVVQGGVVVVGDVPIVGQGGFGAGQQRIVRLAGGVATTIATGFNSLGGFAYANGVLYVVDNGGDLAGATSGDTLYAIPDPVGRADALAAADAEVLPSGTFPFGQDVVVLPDGRLLVSDSVGPGAGRIALVDGTAVTTLVPGLDYASGLALDAGAVLVANLDGSFVGAVRRFALDGHELAPVASSLSGAFAVAVDGDGQTLVSGGLADDFSSTVVAVDANGTVSERARGFAFTTELFYDVARDETLVLDAGASALTAICRDRDGDGQCDVGQGCTEDGVVSASIVSGFVKGELPAPGKLVVRARLGFAGNVPRAEPRQSGVRIRLFESAGAVLDITVPPGDGWGRLPEGAGWRWSGTTADARRLYARVRVEKDQAVFLVKATGTVHGTTSMGAALGLGGTCGAVTTNCAVRQLRTRAGVLRRTRMRCGG